MNNFELPVKELLAGPMRWFGGKSADIAHLQPLKKQIGLTESWPEWMEDGRTSRSFQASLLLGELLLPNLTEELISAGFSDLAFTAIFSDISGIHDWLEPRLEAEALLNLNACGMKRWALIGVSRNLAVGAIAIETEWPRVGYSVDYDSRVLVHISPLKPEFADEVAHLSPQPE